MKYLSYIFTLIFATFVLTTSIFLFFPHKLNDTDNLIPQPVVNKPLRPQKTITEQMLDNMTPEQKVGQLFLLGFDGTTLSSDTKQFIHDNSIGGVILFAKNISNEKQLKKLVNDIQSSSNIPLFIAIDQEGGSVHRIEWNSIMTISEPEIQTQQQAYSLAKDRGELLKSYGINMNLAPVAEYITNPQSFLYLRVFRGSMNEVIQKSIASVNGYRDSKIISVLKHFPGHSDSSPDSHNSLPIVNISKAQWTNYIQPFSDVIKQTEVEGIMVGHIKFSQIDNLPASLSKEIITNRLIKQLDYKGLIISDDMEMDAVENIGTYTNNAYQALSAGEDILIYSGSTPNDIKIQKSVYSFILSKVKSGQLNVDTKVLKILNMKLKYDLLSN